MPVGTCQASAQVKAPSATDMPGITKKAEMARNGASLADQAYYMVRERICAAGFAPARFSAGARWPRSSG